MPKPLKSFLATLYFIVLFYIVFFLSQRGVTDFKGVINSIPCRKVIVFFKYQDNYEPLRLFTFLIELFGNVVLFMPFSFAVQQLFNKKHSLKKVLSVVLLLSVFIEIVQYELNIGVADIDDVILNTLGGFLGYFLSNRQNKLSILCRCKTRS